MRTLTLSRSLTRSLTLSLTLSLALSLAACTTAKNDSSEAAHHECTSCHEAEYRSAPNHVGVRPNTCWSCHSQDAWKPATDVISSASMHGEEMSHDPEPMIPDASADADADVDADVDAREDLDASSDADAPDAAKKKRKITPPPPPPPPTVVPTTAPTLDIPPTGASRRRGPAPNNNGIIPNPSPPSQ